MNILALLSSILDFIKKNLTFCLIAAVVILSVLYVNGCNENKKIKQQAALALQINKQNDSALISKENTIKLKNGENEEIKVSYVTQLNNLNNINKSLAAQVKAEKGVVQSLISAQTSIKLDSIKTSNLLVKFSTTQYGLKFNIIKKDTGLFWNLYGMSKFSLVKDSLEPGSTTIDSSKLNVNIILGFEELNNEYRVFARSASPLVTFNNLSGVLIIPKSSTPSILCPPAPAIKHFSIGPFIGGGFTTTTKISPLIGFGISYSLIQF